VSLSENNGEIAVCDLSIEVVIPLDGRHYRMLGIDEFADAIEAEHLSLAEEVGG